MILAATQRRQIALPDSGPVPYWMRPEYVNAGRRVVGWAPGDPKRFAHDLLAVNKIPGEANLTDIIRKLDQLLRAGALEELQEQASRERERPEEGDDDHTGPPIPRDPKPPTDPGTAGVSAAGCRSATARLWLRRHAWPGHSRWLRTARTCL